MTITRYSIKILPPTGKFAIALCRNEVLLTAVRKQ